MTSARRSSCLLQEEKQMSFSMMGKMGIGKVGGYRSARAL